MQHHVKQTSINITKCALRQKTMFTAEIIIISRDHKIAMLEAASQLFTYLRNGVTAVGHSSENYQQYKNRRGDLTKYMQHEQLKWFSAFLS